MPSRDNLTVPDVYTELSTLRFEPVARVSIIVTNNPIFAQFAIADPPGLYGSAYDFRPDERRMLLAVWNWSTTDFDGKLIVGVRVRNAVAGSPAQVTIHA